MRTVPRQARAGGTTGSRHRSAALAASHVLVCGCGAGWGPHPSAAAPARPAPPSATCFRHIPGTGASAGLSGRRTLLRCTGLSRQVADTCKAGSQPRLHRLGRPHRRAHFACRFYEVGEQGLPAFAGVVVADALTHRRPTIRSRLRNGAPPYGWGSWYSRGRLVSRCSTYARLAHSRLSPISAHGAVSQPG